MKRYNWAVLGCGDIAGQMAEAMKSLGRTFYGAANRTQEKAVEFAEKYGVQKVYGRIDEIFEDDHVDIIYIATPHNTHSQYMQKALRAGKHVLCEKSITLNSKELE